MTMNNHVRECVAAVRKLSEVDRIKALKTLDQLYVAGYLCANRGRKQWLSELVSTKRQIAACAENGRVALVESGMDCDGVQYSGRVRLCKAKYAQVCKVHDSIAKWADGPFNIEIMRPSEAKLITPASRDLAAEAFEDGHPHVLIPGAYTN